MSHDFDTIVIGAGVVGLSVARALSISKKRVLLLEKEKIIGSGISSRNSEVIHAGIYYPINSLKRKFCIAGKNLLIDYCKKNNIPYELIGKLIVATNNDEAETLLNIYKKGVENGVTDLEILDKDDLKSHEPELYAQKAIFSPRTGILDSHSFMFSLLTDFEKNGGIISLNSEITSIKNGNQEFAVSVNMEDDFEVTSKEIINCAGLNAQDVSHLIPNLYKKNIPPRYLCKGNYFGYSTKIPFSKLIYPVPNKAGLGIHLTLDLSGHAKFGPDTEWIDDIDYTVNNNLRNKFYNSIKKYFPNVNEQCLTPDYSGIRPKLVQKNEAASDFIIHTKKDHGIRGYLALYGIESPGLTSALAIADYIVNKKAY
jgi:L-2-hydroxyglutarate oxidase LhgO